MRPASDAFLRAVRGSHGMAARARLVPAGQTGTDPDGDETPIIAGDVLLDATARVRGIADVTTLGSWPTTPADPLAPYGQEIFLERGLRFGNGVTEWISLGYFRLNDIEQEDVPLGAVRIAAGDRMAGLEDARLLAPRQFAAGVTVGEVFADLVGEVYPGVPIEWDEPATRDAAIGRGVVAEQDRRGFLADLVAARGKEWHFDHRGVLVIRTPANPTEPVQQLHAGEDGVLVQMERSLSRVGTYNAVVAMGEAPDTGEPVRAVAIDNDPDSPTYFHGPFGPVPRFYSSPFITTTEQAESAARTMLSQVLGLPYAVDLEAVPNPALEPLDPVSIAYPSGRRMRYETHVLERLRVPLTAEGEFTGTTREQTFATIGVL